MQVLTSVRNRKKSSWLPPPRSILLTTVAILLVISLLMIASSSLPYANSKQYSNDLYFFYNQLIYAGLGIALAWGVSKIPLRHIFNFTFLFFSGVACIGLLLYTLMFGINVYGSTRWISLGFANFQPAELLKLVMILFTSDYLVRRSYEIRGNTWMGFFRIAVIVTMVGFLLLAQPDFGSLAVITACLASMLFVAGLPKGQVVFAITVLSAMLVTLILGASYRLKRVLTFLDPFDDVQDSDYQLARSLVAFARGEWTGVGYGESILKLSHLPEAHTDFILAITGEELGLSGVLFILALQAILIATIMKISFDALKRNQRRLSYFAFGTGMLFFAQVLINGGMNLGILPTKGLTMPFFSYGGSSLIINLIAIGILLRIVQESPDIPKNECRYY